MAKAKPSLALKVVTLVKYEAISYCARPTEVFKSLPDGRSRYFRERKYVYRHKEVWRKTFTTLAKLRAFLRESTEAKSYVSTGRRPNRWIFPQSPRVDQLSELCITEGDAEVYFQDNTSVDKGYRRLTWHPGHKRRRRRYSCSCWYCSCNKLRNSMTGRKGERRYRLVEAE